MNDQVSEIRDKILNILRYNNVKRASLFGSVVRGELSDDSDIDILIEYEGKKSLLNLVSLKFELEDILKRKVDVLTYNSLNPLLRDRILNEQEIIL